MKIIIKLLLIVTIFLGFFYGINTYAGTAKIDVNVTEAIPGVECRGAPPNITCSVGIGFSSVLGMLESIIKWLSFLAMLGGVLFIIVNGILYTMGGNKDEIKKRIIKTLSGIIILLLSGTILYIIAPWVYN